MSEVEKPYTEGLRRADLDPNPIKQFGLWFQRALAASLPEPNAMTLATASKHSVPSARIVLLKAFDENGFTFFTNYHSPKGQDLEENPRAALVLFWAPLERQIRISGRVSRVSKEISEEYFHHRPVGSQLGAWASRQSEVLESREALEKHLQEVSRQYEGKIVTLPPHWGGYRVAPEMIEFWQGRPNRLHDRFRYTRIADHEWKIERLSP
jgi:pyridoxamine 5'-phosphate oxidase